MSEACHRNVDVPKDSMNIYQITGCSSLLSDTSPTPSLGNHLPVFVSGDSTIGQEICLSSLSQFRAITIFVVVLPPIVVPSNAEDTGISLAGSRSATNNSNSFHEWANEKVHEVEEDTNEGTK